MTVETTTNRARYVGNGAQTVFDYDFIIPTADELEVYYTTVAGVTTLLDPTEYTVTGIDDPNGGTVTYFPGSVAIPANSILLIQRTVPYTQPVDLVNQDGFYPQVVEEALDNLEMQIQQLKSTQDRNLVVGVTDTTPGELPSAAERANKFLAFDANGEATASIPVNSSLVSSAMAPVVAAATLAAGRTAFGLGELAIYGIGEGIESDGAGNVRTNYHVRQDSTNQAVVSSMHATQRLATGALSYTCPRANTLFEGFGLWIYALTSSVSILIDINDNFVGMASGATLIIPPGTQAFISTDGATNGLWACEFNQLVGTDSPLNLRLNATVATNALTVSIKDRNGLDPSTTSPVLLAFRDPTATGGGPVIRTATSALSITVPNTATLGTASATPFRLWVVLFDNAGTLVPGLILASTSTSFKSLDEAVAASGVAISTGATSAQIYYTSSIVTSKSFRILGYIDFDSGQVTAGTWLTAPSRIQLMTRGTKLPGDVIQRARTVLTAMSTGTTVVPEDDTIPQITEGDEYMTQAITPFAKMNLLRVTARLEVANSGSNQIAVCLFQDAIAGALSVSAATGGSVRNVQPTIDKTLLANTTSSTTFRIRAGGAGNTNTVNGIASARVYGGVMESFIQAEEIMA